MIIQDNSVILEEEDYMAEWQVLNMLAQELHIRYLGLDEDLTSNADIEYLIRDDDDNIIVEGSDISYVST